MRAVTIAAAGAAAVGSVSAASHKHMHAKHHVHVARDNWFDWNTTTTSAAPVTAVSTTTAEAWEDWTTVDSGSDAKKSTVDVWGDWTTKTGEAATATETWGDWTTAADPTATETWADWSSAASPAATSTKPWGEWVGELTTVITVEGTITKTLYVAAETGASSTWAEWVATSSAPVAAVTTVLTSTIAPGWSSAGWFGPSWSLAPGSCAVEVLTSYGFPTWYPTPVAATTATTTTTSTTTPSPVWADWTTTTTTAPVAVVTTATSTTTPSPVWADWTTTTTTAPVAVVTTTAETWADWTTTTTTAPVAVITTTTSAETWADWTTTPASPAVATSTAVASGWGKPSGGKPSGGAPGITANGNSWGMTYSPYTSSGGCKDAGTVAADLAIVAEKGFTSIRIYSTDCSSLENIGGAARTHGLKLILGVWISSTGISGAQGQVSDIVGWAQWDLVELIVVGNEAVFNGYCSASELAGFVGSSASAFKGAGYSGLVSLTEPLSIWEDTSSASEFCAVVDVIGANLYAFFNAGITADKAGAFIQSEIDILNGICSGKDVYVLESGWPHAGSCNGAACPSPENQATALKGIQDTVGAQVVFLSFEDEPWKEPGQFDVEQYWGCAGVF